MKHLKFSTTVSRPNSTVGSAGRGSDSRPVPSRSALVKSDSFVVFRMRQVVVFAFGLGNSARYLLGSILDPLHDAGIFLGVLIRFLVFADRLRHLAARYAAEEKVS